VSVPIGWIVALVLELGTLPPGTPDGVVAQPPVPTPAASLPGAADPGVAFASLLVDLGDAQGAALEFRRAVSGHPDGAVAYAALRGLARAEVMRGDPVAAESALRDAEAAAASDLDREDCLLERALVAMAAGREEQASMVFFDLEHRTVDSLTRAKSEYFAGICALRRGQWEEARQAFAKSLQPPLVACRGPESRQLDSLLANSALLPHRSPTLARWMSTVLPGAGQAYAGDLRNGLDAIAVNTFAVWLLLQSSRGRNWDQVALNMTMLLSRYYLGNRYQAGARAERHNQAVANRLGERAERIARAAVR
jgi:hypothetical protein